jgi:hypothetical protein
VKRKSKHRFLEEPSLLKERRPRHVPCKNCKELTWKHAVLAASHEDQKNIALTTILALLAWKESAIAVTPPLQEIGRELLVCLGDSIHDKILPGIKSLKYERDSLQSSVRFLDREMTSSRIELMDAEKALAKYVASFDAHRTKLREIMDCARRDIRGTIYFRDEERKRLEELSQ